MIAPRKYRYKPVVVEAVQLTDSIVDFLNVYAWADARWRVFRWEDASWGDWVIRDDDGHFHLIEAATFEATFEPVD